MPDGGDAPGSGGDGKVASYGAAADLAAVAVAVVVLLAVAEGVAEIEVIAGDTGLRRAAGP
jgi:hypothetical protein